MPAHPPSRLPNPAQMDSTRLRSWLLCKRRFYYSHVLGIEPAGDTPTDLVFGSAVHEMFEFWEHRIAEGLGEDAALEAALEEAFQHTLSWEDDPAMQGAKNRLSLLRLLCWYAEQFPPSSDPVQPVLIDGRPATEMRFDLPLDMLAASLGLPRLNYGIWPEPPSLCGRLDTIVSGPGASEHWVREKKTTTASLSPYYLARYSPDIQISIYAMVGRLVLPNLRLRGILLEAMQIGVNYVRIGRFEIERHAEQSAETLVTIANAFREMAELGLPGGQSDPAAFPLNEAACMDGSGGKPCAFRPLCNSHPSLRAEEIAKRYRQRPEAWNPLSGAGHAVLTGTVDNPESTS